MAPQPPESSMISSCYEHVNSLDFIMRRAVRADGEHGVWTIVLVIISSLVVPTRQTHDVNTMYTLSYFLQGIMVLNIVYNDVLIIGYHERWAVRTESEPERWAVAWKADALLRFYHTICTPVGVGRCIYSWPHGVITVTYQEYTEIQTRWENDVSMVYS